MHKTVLEDNLPSAGAAFVLGAVLPTELKATALRELGLGVILERYQGLVDVGVVDILGPDEAKGQHKRRDPTHISWHSVSLMLEKGWDQRKMREGEG